MPDLEALLHDYGRQLEELVAAEKAGVAEVPEPTDPVASRRQTARRAWVLVAVATAAVAVAASLLLPAARPEGPEGDEMTNRGTGLALGICLFGAAACTSGANSAEPPVSAAAQATSTSVSTSASEPTASASADASGSSAGTDEPPPLFEGPREVEPGTYVVDLLGPRLQVTVPDGYDRYPESNAIQGPQFAYLAFGLANPADALYVWTDACDYVGKAAPVGQTIDEFVAALEAMQNMDTTDPRPIEFGGYSGVEIVLSLPAGLDVNTCYGGTTSLYGNSDEFGIPGPVDPDAAITIRILDIDGKLASINFGSNHALEPDTQADLDAIVDSLTWEEPG